MDSNLSSLLFKLFLDLYNIEKVSRLVEFKTVNTTFHSE